MDMLAISKWPGAVDSSDFEIVCLIKLFPELYSTESSGFQLSVKSN